jgi:CRISPR-associated protein Cas2
MNEERLYIVAYDIADTKRWRRVFRTMQGYGEWLQLSIFQCRLTKRRRQELETLLREVIRNDEDHVLVVDVGSADRTELAVASLGKSFTKMEREATVI